MADPERSELDRSACAGALAAFLREARDWRLAAAADAGHGRRRQRLREWQAARLADTHADLLASSRFGEAAAFFLAELYGPKDFSQRDAEVERILPMLTAMLPVSGLRTILLAVEVDALSERFDAAMVAALGDRLDQPVLTGEDYAAAYCAIGDRPGRALQIRLIIETGEALESLARSSFVRGILRMMHGPAYMAGLGELHSFLARGFDAFHGMVDDADEFLATIRERENEFSAGLFAGSGLPG
jgi:hypothetical protein